ncbi:LysR substrate-binding domain-containing protein [uncultured Mameliella sp.]|uniref:LysR substrate-binding domain-containing protein n=1 Tax=uncultured Mameliella sp. TaxID=1447087 RepID=UPI00262FACDF|nr:LysR substrate-binding domain-containing protein [uncultured Mameliella sp.]
MPLSHLNAWRAVDAVLSEGSVARAAVALGVTQAAVSAQIRRLEDRLGRTLFRRTSGGLEPVEDLAGLAPALHSGFAAIASVQDALRSGLGQRRVALTVTQTFAESWLPHHLPDLFARLGAVDLRIDTSWEVVDLAGSDVHFAIRFMPQPGPGYGAIDLLPSGVVPVCTPEFARRYGLTPGQTDLSGVPIAHIDVPTTDAAWLDWQGWSRATGIDISSANDGPRFALKGSGARIARAGIGLVLGGLSDVVHSVESGALVMPFGLGSVVPAEYWHRLLWYEKRPLGPVQRKFRDWIGARAADDHAKMRILFGI